MLSNYISLRLHSWGDVRLLNALMEEERESVREEEKKKSARVLYSFLKNIYMFFSPPPPTSAFALVNNSRREKDKRGSVQEQQSRNIYGARKLTSQIFLSKVLHFAEGENLLS